MIDKKDTYKTVFWNKSPTIQEKTKNFTPVKTKPKGFTNSVEKFGGIIKELTESRKEMQKKTENSINRSWNPSFHSFDSNYRPYSERLKPYSERKFVPAKFFDSYNEKLAGRSVSRDLKKKYDYCNDSPITWCPLAYSPVKKSNINKPTTDYQNIIKSLSIRLNSKRIFKGMGYKKSYIFS